MSYNPELYMHDMDRKAFDALNTFPKLVKLREAYCANVDEKQRKIALLSTAIKLSDNQMPEIYNSLPPICRKLGISIPELYLVQSKDINAATFGSTNPFIYITSELVEKIPAHLIPTVLAHECGHIACNHSLYYNLAWDLLFGVDRLILCKIPAISKYFTPALQRTLLLWSRCSELSADRAAALCDGNSENTVDLLLRLHGFGENINRAEYVKQAYELKKYVNESPENKAIEQLLVKDDDHPLLATRTYECCDWVKTDTFKGIIDGSITITDVDLEELQETNAVEMEVSIKEEGHGMVPPEAWAALNQRIDQLNVEVDRYTDHSDKIDYSVAMGCGLLSGIIDSVFIGAFDLQSAHEWGSEKTEAFVIKVAKWQGYKGDDIKGAILYLAENKKHTESKDAGFHLASDSNTRDFGGGLQHHLRDFAHHPNIVGLIFSMLTQFTGKCYGTDTNGSFVVCDVRDGTYVGEDIPHKFLYGTVYWFFHMVSDMAGSGTDSEGTGIPGPILSLAKLISATPFFKDKVDEKEHRNLSVAISKMFNGTMFGERDENGKLIPLRFDLRTELGVFDHLKKEAMVVALNESIVKAFYAIRRFVLEITEKDIRSLNDLKKIDVDRINPSRNRTADRMVMVASITFNVADTADAAVRAAIESGGNWVIFSGKFVARYNYVGAGRTALAIVKEVSNEKKEAQLIHERMLLMDTKAQIKFEQLQVFKAELEEKLTTYLAEDIEAFMEGFEYINEGIALGDSNAVIRGNVVIQKVLGREPQFTNQEEFDDLMESDEAFQF